MLADMNLREVGLGPEGQVACWEGQLAGSPCQGRLPGWPSLGIWVGPPFTAARQKERAPDGAVGQGGDRPQPCPFTLGVIRKDVFVGVTDGSPQALVGVALALL